MGEVGDNLSNRRRIHPFGVQNQQGNQFSGSAHYLEYVITDTHRGLEFGERGATSRGIPRLAR